MRIALISDTHGLIRPELESFLDGSDLILHAGDVGSADCLLKLESIAPFKAVRGNVDYSPWADFLPLVRTESVEGIHFHMTHVESDLRFNDSDPGLHCGLYGHSHKPGLETRGKSVYLNPGSVGPRRFRLPISVADAFIEDGGVSFSLYHLEAEGSRWSRVEQLDCEL